MNNLDEINERLDLIELKLNEINEKLKLIGEIKND